jgi:hypothetical protein
VRRAIRALFVAVALLGPVYPAAAQAGRPTVHPPRFAISAGLLMNGGYDLGARTAELRGNAVVNATPFTLFRTDSEMERVAGLDGRFGYAFTRALSIEVGGTWSKPDVSVTVGQDPESSGTTVIGETVSQYTVDVGAVVGLPWPRQAGRVRSYALGGAGYLRQLHEDRLLVETGHTIFGGGGIQYLFRAPSRGRPLGVRAEARLVRRGGGIDFEDRSRTHPAFSLLGFAGF